MKHANVFHIYIYIYLFSCVCSTLTCGRTDGVGSTMLRIYIREVLVSNIGISAGTPSYMSNVMSSFVYADKCLYGTSKLAPTFSSPICSMFSGCYNPLISLHAK
jgi:hypothetical protein